MALLLILALNPFPRDRVAAAHTRAGAAYSAGPEDWIVRDFLHNERGGVFVDVGAGPARQGSNTYLLEKDFNWSGVAIDAQAEYEPEYRTLRRRTRYVTAFLDSSDGAAAELWIIPHRPQSSSRDLGFATYWAGRERPVRRVFTTMTLNSVLRDQHIQNIDYLNLDVELSEPRVLAGFDIDRYRPRIVSVEGHEKVRQQILDYFGAHGYVIVGRYWQFDPMNLWFMPLPAKVKDHD